MNVKCPCGGRFRRSDIVEAGLLPNGKMAYKDTDPLVAHWRCDNCMSTRQKRKRQPKKVASA